MTTLSKQTLSEFSRSVASSQPVPGGGSVSALAGALAASLGQMVLNLTIPKKLFEKLDAANQEALQMHFNQLESLQPRLVSLIDEDTQAYAAFMQALRLPKETKEEQAERAEAMSQASVQALEVPLDTAQTALKVLAALPMIARYGNRNAISDAGVACALAYAAVEGGILNVLINLPGIPPERHTEIKNQTDEIKTQAEELRGQIMARVYGRLI